MEIQLLIIMKTYMQKLKKAAGWLLAFAIALALAQSPASGAETSGTGHSPVTVPEVTAPVTSTGAAPDKPVVVENIEPLDLGRHFGHREATWLGVAVEEAPDVLAAQLGLDPGVGLVVTYVATNSPAAKAGLKENDVLVEFDGQPLVHPAQLRKLVQVRKEGDIVKLTFYRTGKKQPVSATLAKTVEGFGFPCDGNGGPFWPFPGAPGGDTFREQMENLHKSLGNIKIDQKQVQEEIRRSMEEARKAYREALRQATNVNLSLGPMLHELAEMGAAVDNDASVTVRSTSQSSKSLVKADDTGTIVIVKNPKLYLTAHDNDGKLLFDGEIETPDQRNQVPRDLWNKVEPLLKKMGAENEKSPDDNTGPAKGT
jgi:Arc/MetJ family transcription regulator